MSVAKDERQSTETLSFRCWRERCRLSRGGFYVRVEPSAASELESLRARFATNVVLANRSPEDSKIQDSA